MKLDTGTWHALSTLLDQALDLPPSAHAPWLAALAQEHAALRPALARLLAQRAAGETADWIGTLPPITLPSLSDSDDGFAPGTQVGPYRLLRHLGQGGMGAVWLAERADGLVKRDVALKLLRVSGSSWALAERFAREREILAALEHPHIARLYDAGFADDGQPYLALEYVEGSPITAECDARNAEVRARLALFLQVLEAVQHAHTRLALHRDLKPSNILVTPQGEVKLLDFGIAKLMEDGAARETALTQVAGRALTPDYASPEQIAGAPLTTASDVYSLGVVLYELLAGARPYRLKRGTRAEIEEAILSQDIVRPSTLVTAAAAAHAGTTQRDLRRQLAGDLDAIARKALRKDAAQRYPTASALADDIERYLSGDVVLAQPESALYRARKFIVRHRLGLGAGASIATVLVAATAVSLHQARVARSEALRASAIQQFLSDVFRANSSDQSDPVKARRTTALELLDRGAAKIETALDGAPEAKIEVLSLLAQMYEDLGVDDRAVGLRKKAVALLRAEKRADDPALAAALLALATSLQSSSSVNEREAVLAEAKAILDARHDFTSSSRAELWIKLAEHFQSTNKHKALGFAEQSVKLRRALPPSFELAEALSVQAQIGNELGQNREAAAALAEAIEVTRETRGDPNPSLPRYYAYLGEAQYHLEEFAAAEHSLRRALETARAVNGEDHVDTLQTEFRLGRFLYETGRTREGLSVLADARSLALKIKGPDDPFHTPQTQIEYGYRLGRYGQLEEGVATMERAIANRRKNRPGTLYLGEMLWMESLSLIDLGRYRQAAANMDEFSAIAEKSGRTAPSAYFNSSIGIRIQLALIEGRVDDADALTEQLFVSVDKEARFPENATERWLLKGEVALARGDATTAVSLAQQARAAIEASGLGVYLESYAARADYLEGRARLRSDDSAAALELLRRARERYQNLLDPRSPRILEVDLVLGECLLATSANGEARQALDAARAIEQAHPELGRHLRLPFKALEQRIAAATH